MFVFEFCCSYLEEVPPGHGQFPLVLQAHQPLKRFSVCSLQNQHLFQVVAYSCEPEMILVADPPEIATSLQPISAFQGADDPLHGPAHP